MLLPSKSASWSARHLFPSPSCLPSLQPLHPLSIWLPFGRWVKCGHWSQRRKVEEKEAGVWRYKHLRSFPGTLIKQSLEPNILLCWRNLHPRRRHYHNAAHKFIQSETILRKDGLGSFARHRRRSSRDDVIIFSPNSCSRFRLRPRLLADDFVTVALSVSSPRRRHLHSDVTVIEAH